MQKQSNQRPMFIMTFCCVCTQKTSWNWCHVFQKYYIQTFKV